MDQPEEPKAPIRQGALIAASIVAASLILSWGISSSAPRYELASAGSAVVRMDTDSGELIACDRQGCTKIEPPSRRRTFGPFGIQIGSDDKPSRPQSKAIPAQ